MSAKPNTKRATSGRGKLVKVRGIENLYRYSTTGIFYACYFRAGRTIKRSLRTKDRQAAKQALAEVLRDSDKVDHQLIRAATLQSLLDLHINVRVALKDESTQKKLNYIGRLFVKTWPGRMTQGLADVRRSDRAMKWLLKEAKKRPDGYLGKVMYEHGLATLALSEMWGMARDPEDDDAIQKALEKAVEVILRSQNPGGGWRYQPQADGGEDTSCTMTVFHALASARQAGIAVPNETIAKVVKYLKGVHDAETGGFAYNEKGLVSFPCTAGGAYIAQLAGQRDTEMVNAALRHLKSQAPGIITGGARYYCYGHYYAIQAMVQAGDDEYAKWYPQIRDALISQQNAQGAWGTISKSGGVSYEMPMAIIILATPHRYIPIYQR